MAADSRRLFPKCNTSVFKHWATEMLWLKKFLFRRRVRELLRALMMPATAVDILIGFQKEIYALTEMAFSRNWTPDIVASIVITRFAKKLIETQFTAEQKADAVVQIQKYCPKTPFEEKQWMDGYLEALRRGDVSAYEHLSGFGFRNIFVSCMLGTWFAGSTIDLFSKALWANITAQSLLSVDQKQVENNYREMLAKIGTDTAAFVSGKPTFKLFKL
jgi:hypothetical protein